MPFKRGFDPTILLVAIGVAAAVMLRVVLGSGDPADGVTAHVQSNTAPAHVRVEPAQVRVEKTPGVPARPEAPEAVQTLEKTTASALPKRPDATTPSVQQSASTIQQPAVTITGCLEQNNDAFRLKDTTSADAPKSRSWRSGFLKKKSPSVEVVDLAHRLELPAHVGQRVVVTGTLVDREMQVRSLRRVSASCNQEA